MLRLCGPSIINALKLRRLYGPNFRFIGERVLLHVTEGKWSKWRKSNVSSKVSSQKNPNKCCQLVASARLELIPKDYVSSAVYSCLQELGSSADATWGEGAHDNLKVLFPK